MIGTSKDRCYPKSYLDTSRLYFGRLFFLNFDFFIFFFLVMIRNEKSPNFRKCFKLLELFTHRFKGFIVFYFFESESILTISDRVTERKNFGICSCSQLLFHKTFNLPFGGSKL